MGVMEHWKEQHKEYAQIIGVENFILLCRAFGGTSIYIPKEEELLKKEKYCKIVKEFTGSNQKELARKYHVSERTIYRITEKNKNCVMQNQMSLWEYVSSKTK